LQQNDKEYNKRNNLFRRFTKYIKMFLPDIISEIVENIRPTSAITAIADNGNGYYTVTVTKLDTLLIDNQFVAITDTPNFNTTSTEVFNVNYTNKTFDIKLATGQTISTFGNFTAKAPFFDYTETFLEYSNNLTFEQQKSFRKDIEMFPAIYMPSKVTENDLGNDTDFEVTDLRFLFIDFTKIDSNTEGRYTDDIPYLMDLYTKFKKEIKKHAKISQGVKFTHEKDTFTEMDTNEAVSQIIASTSLIYSTNGC